MAAALHCTGVVPATKVLERYQVAPPPGSVSAPAPLPLTAFDVFFYPLQDPVQRVFFYRLPSDAAEDEVNIVRCHQVVAALRRSLPLALQRFYPLAGRLVPTPGSAVPNSLCYAEGESVELTVAQRDDDFAALTDDGPKDAFLLRGLAPSFLTPDGWRGQPVLALQVTIFPAGANRGVAVGVSTHQVAVDGHSVIQFMKAWAGFCRGEEDGGGVDPPLFDRSMVVAEPGGLGQSLLELLQDKSSEDNIRRGGGVPNGKITTRTTERSYRPNDAVHATFRLDKAQLNMMQRWVSERTSCRVDNEAFSSGAAPCSPFALATALVWTALAKARPAAPPKWLVFLYGVRGHIGQPAAVLLRYFGNCVGTCVVEAAGGSRKLLPDEEGFVAAACAVWDAILGLDRKGVIRRMERVARFFRALDETCTNGGAEEAVIVVAGSPKLGSYEVDFGWGRPEKVEIVSIASSQSMSLTEWEEGSGFEVGMVLPKRVMDLFAARFSDGLRMCSLCYEN